MHGLSEVEAKCIIMYTHSQSLRVPDHPRPLSLPKSYISCSTRHENYAKIPDNLDLVILEAIS
jgi:hypothetical protein